MGKVKKIDQDIHYKYGGSTADRTLKCNGWVALTKSLGLTGGGGSSAANRGSMLHKGCEVVVRDKVTPESLLDRSISYGEWTLDRELLETKIIPALDELDMLRAYHGLESVPVEAEEVFEINPLVGGTIDISIIDPSVYVIADFKFGEGIMVYAKENSQLFFYAWIKIVDLIKASKRKKGKPVLRDTKVVLAIIQPADRKEEYLDTWETTVGDVLDFGERFLKAVDIAEKSKPEENLCAGSHCHFCPCAGSGGCPEKIKAGTGALALINTDALKKLDSLKVIDKESDFSTLNLKQALILAAQLEPWIKQVRSFAFKQLELGAKDIGYKLVPKRASKSWTDPIEVTRYLKRRLKAANAMVSTVISPAQAKKVAKRLGVDINLENRITIASSGSTLVPDSDKRDALLSDKAKIDALKQLGK